MDIDLKEAIEEGIKEDCITGVKVLWPLMHDLCKIPRQVLEGGEGVFIDNKDDWVANESEAIQEL